jgi:hypothetical protein
MNAESLFLFDKPLIMALALLFGAFSGVPERKRRNDDLDSNLTGFDNDLEEDKSVAVGCGCSISFDTSSEVPIVYVKTYGKVDRVSLRRTLEARYPGVRIEGLSSHKSVQLNIETRKKPKRKESKK